MHRPAAAALSPKQPQFLRLVLKHMCRNWKVALRAAVLALFVLGFAVLLRTGSRVAPFTYELF